jgi:hypothetical protein
LIQQQQPDQSRAERSKLRSGFVSVTRLQAVAYLLVLIVAMAWRWNGHGGSSWALIVMTALYGFAFGQLMLAACATVFGPWNLMLRLTIPPLVIWLQLGLSLALLDSTVQISFAVLYSSLGIGLWAAAQLPLWLYRYVTHYRLAPADIAFPETDKQFSIGQLLYLTFVVAALLSLGRLMLSMEAVRGFFSFHRGSALAFAVIATATTATTLIALKATLFNRPGWASFSGSTIAAGFVIAALLMTLRKLDPPGMSGSFEKEMLATSVLVQYLWMVLNLHALRAAGWRFAPVAMVRECVNRPLQSTE